MAKRRAQHAPVGLTSNGIVLMNVLTLLAPEQARRVRASLPKGLGNDWFVGVPLRGAAVETVLARVDDAAAETVAKMRMGIRTTTAKPRKR